MPWLTPGFYRAHRRIALRRIALRRIAHRRIALRDTAIRCWRLMDRGFRRMPSSMVMKSGSMRATMLVLGLMAVACSSADGQLNPSGAGVGGSDAGSACGLEERAGCRVDQMACQMQASIASCVPCTAGTYAAESGLCEAIGGTPLSHSFPDNTTPAGGELRGLCRSWTLDNAEELWINAFELEQDELSHHSNWTFVPDDDFDGPDGIWKCSDRNYSQLSAALSGGVIYAQSTQADHEVQKFPGGVAVRIPPFSRIISDIHTLNTTANEVIGNVKITLYGIDVGAVDVKLVPFHVSYEELDIPPQSTSRFSGECEIDSVFQSTAGSPFVGQVYYMLPHTHALGTRMFVEAFGGPDGDVSLVDVSGFNGEARGRNYDPPLDLSGHKGLRFGCEFYNPRAESVHWGFDDQEMCEALGFASSPLAFESRISEAKPDGEEDGILKFTGDCNTAAFPWDHEKAGGSGGGNK
jgi:hypothetical protein